MPTVANSTTSNATGNNLLASASADTKSAQFEHLLVASTPPKATVEAIQNGVRVLQNGDVLEYTVKGGTLYVKSSAGTVSGQAAESALGQVLKTGGTEVASGILGGLLKVVGGTATQLVLDAVFAPAVGSTREDQAVQFSKTVNTIQAIANSDPTGSLVVQTSQVNGTANYSLVNKYSGVSILNAGLDTGVRINPNLNADGKFTFLGTPPANLPPQAFNGALGSIRASSLATATPTPTPTPTPAPQPYSEEASDRAILDQTIAALQQGNVGPNSYDAVYTAANRYQQHYPEQQQAAQNTVDLLAYLLSAGDNSKQVVDGLRNYINNTGPTKLSNLTPQNLTTVQGTLDWLDKTFPNSQWQDYKNNLQDLAKLYNARATVNNFMNGASTTHDGVNDALAYLKAQDPSRDTRQSQDYFDTVYILNSNRDKIPQGTAPNQIDVTQFKGAQPLLPGTPERPALPPGPEVPATTPSNPGSPGGLPGTADPIQLYEWPDGVYRREKPPEGLSGGGVGGTPPGGKPPASSAPPPGDDENWFTQGIKDWLKNSQTNWNKIQQGDVVDKLGTFRTYVANTIKTVGSGLLITNAIGAAGAGIFYFGGKEQRTASTVDAASAFAELAKLQANPDRYLANNYTNTFAGASVGDIGYNISGHLLQFKTANGATYLFRRVPEDLYNSLLAAQKQQGNNSDQVFVNELVVDDKGGKTPVWVEIRPPYREEPLRDAGITIKTRDGGGGIPFLPSDSFKITGGIGPIEGFRPNFSFESTFNSRSDSPTTSTFRIGFPSPTQGLGVGIRQQDTTIWSRFAGSAGAIDINGARVKDLTDPNSFFSGQELQVANGRVYLDLGNRNRIRLDANITNPDGSYAFGSPGYVRARETLFVELGLGADFFKFVFGDNTAINANGYLELQAYSPDLRAQANFQPDGNVGTNGTGVRPLPLFEVDPALQLSTTKIPRITEKTAILNSGESWEAKKSTSGPSTVWDLSLTALPKGAGPSAQDVRGQKDVQDITLADGSVAQVATVNNKRYLALGQEVFDISNSSAGDVRNLKYQPGAADVPGKLVANGNFILNPIADVAIPTVGSGGGVGVVPAQDAPSLEDLTKNGKNTRTVTLPDGLVLTLQDLNGVTYAQAKIGDRTVLFDVTGKDVSSSILIPGANPALIPAQSLRASTNDVSAADIITKGARLTLPDGRVAFLATIDGKDYALFRGRDGVLSIYDTTGYKRGTIVDFLQSLRADASTNPAIVADAGNGVVSDLDTAPYAVRAENPTYTGGYSDDEIKSLINQYNSLDASLKSGDFGILQTSPFTFEPTVQKRSPNLDAIPGYGTTAPGGPLTVGEIKTRFPELFGTGSAIDPNSVAGVYNTARETALSQGKTEPEAVSAAVKALWSVPANVAAYANGYAGSTIGTLSAATPFTGTEKSVITQGLTALLLGKDPDAFAGIAAGYFAKLKQDLAGGTPLSQAIAKASPQADVSAIAPQQVQTVTRPPQPDPTVQQTAKVLGDISTYLGWVNSIVSKVDGAAGADIGKAVSVADAASKFLTLFNGIPAGQSQIEDAAYSLFNAMAAFSPDVAKIAPEIKTANDAYKFITSFNPSNVGTIGGLTQANLGLGFASDILGLIGAPKELQQIFSGISLGVQGALAFIGGAVVPIVGWVVSLASFIFSLFGGGEKWGHWQTILSNVSVDAGQDPITGQVLPDDTVDQKTSSNKNNRVRYTGQASEAPIQTAGFSLTPETVAQAAPNSQYQIVSLYQDGGDGSGMAVSDLKSSTSVTVRTTGGQQFTLYARGTDDNTGERIFSGSDGNDGWISVGESQLAPKVQVPTGNYILNLNVNFASVNADVNPVGKSQSFTISGDQAAQIRAAFGAGGATIGGSDGRIASLRPYINQLGAVTWETSQNTPNVYVYDDINHDGVPDLVREGVLRNGDNKYEVTLNSNDPLPSLPPASGPITQVPGITVLGDTISNNQLNANQAIVSADGHYMAVMQGDGNLVVYDRTTGKATWSSGTDRKAAGGFAAMQGDGNLVVYAPGNNAKWSSKTSAAGANRPFSLTMQGDGNLVVRDSQGGQPLWSSQTGRIAIPAVNQLKQPAFSFTANSQQESYAVGGRANVLMVYLASHPELYDLYFSQPQAHANGNITLIYEWAQQNGVLPKLDQLLALAGPPQGATLADQIQDMANRGAQIAQLKADLGIKVDPAHLDQYPDLKAAFHDNTLQLLNHYVTYGNEEGRAVNDAGQVLTKWHPLSTGWSDLQALDYVASYADLMNAFGTNADAARAHWNNNGRWEGRASTFDPEAYLASRPDVRAAAIAALTNPGTAVASGGYEGSVDVTLPNGGGQVRLYARGTDDNTGEAVYAGSDGNDGWISMTQSQINALAAPVPPSEADIELFAVKHYITNGRFEAAGVAPPPPPAPPVPQAPAVVTLGDRTQNRVLQANDSLLSASGRYRAIMQADGNFVVYDGGKAIFSTGTNRKAEGGSIAIQGDGNLVVYAPGMSAKWSSGTSAADVNRPFTLVMQDDGNLVLYDSQQSAKAIWASKGGHYKPPANASSLDRS